MKQRKYRCPQPGEANMNVAPRLHINADRFTDEPLMRLRQLIENVSIHPVSERFLVVDAGR